MVLHRGYKGAVFGAVMHIVPKQPWWGFLSATGGFLSTMVGVLFCTAGISTHIAHPNSDVLSKGGGGGGGGISNFVHGGLDKNFQLTQKRG